MATMNITLPDQMKDWVTAQETSGKYNNASEYMRELIRRDQERTAQTALLQALLTDGIASGISDLSFDEIIAQADKEYDQTQAVPS